MNRQLLPRRAETRAAATLPAQRSRPVPAPERAQQVVAARAPVLRRPAVLVLVTAGAAGLALLAWVLLTGSADATEGQPSPFARPAARPTATAAPTASTARAGSTLPAGRDPFAADGLRAGAEAGGGSAPGLGTPPNGAPTSPPHTETVVPVPAPASPTTSPTGAPPPGGGGAASPTVTVTVTTGASYLGLYGWNGDRAAFRLNTTPFHLTVGSSSSTGLRLTGTVRKGSLTCAVVSNPSTHQTSLTVCPGQVVRLG